MYNCALIGCGSWGMRVGAKILNHPDFNLVSIATKTDKILSHLNPKVRHTYNYMDIILDDSIDLVYAAVHPEVMKNVVPACIYHDKNVIVEKPLFDNLNDFEETKNLIRRWHYNNLFLVNYIHLFNQTFIDWMNDIVDTGKNGVFSINVRGPVKRDNMRVKLDYGSHAVAMCLSIADRLGKGHNLTWKVQDEYANAYTEGHAFTLRYGNSNPKDVSVTFIDYLGDTLTWRDDRGFDSLGNLLTIASQNLNTPFSNFDLAYRVGRILLT